MVTLASLMIYLIISVLSACTLAPVGTRLDLKWQFVNAPGEPMRACLEEQEIIKLKEALRRCEVKQ